MSFVDRYLPYFWQQLISHLLSGPLPFSALFTESSQENQLCSPSPFSSALKAPHPLCCMSFSVSCLLSNFFLKGVGQTVQEIMLVYFSSSYGNTACCLFAHLLVRVFQADLELVSRGAGLLLFSQCNVAWRSFVQAGGLWCWSFASSWRFFSAKCGSSISARFLIYGTHAVCFLSLVTVLDPPLLVS
jgi:hypothetical protein